MDSMNLIPSIGKVTDPILKIEVENCSPITMKVPHGNSACYEENYRLAGYYINNHERVNLDRELICHDFDYGYNDSARTGEKYTYIVNPLSELTWHETKIKPGYYVLWIYTKRFLGERSKSDFGMYYQESNAVSFVVTE